jgi:hypothetical protein
VASKSKLMYVLASATCVFVSALVAQTESDALESRLDAHEYPIAGPSDTCPADGHPTCAHPTATESPEGPGWTSGTCPADGHPTCAHPTATESPEG